MGSDYSKTFNPRQNQNFGARFQNIAESSSHKNFCLRIIRSVICESLFKMEESGSYTSSESEEEVFNVFDQLGNVANPPIQKKIPLKEPTQAKKRRSRGPSLSVYKTNVYILRMFSNYYSFLCYFLLGEGYLKDGGKRSKARYNYQQGFKSKMLQYKTLTHDDVSVTFRQSTATIKKGYLDSYAYATNVNMIAKPRCVSKETQSNKCCR